MTAEQRTGVDEMPEIKMSEMYLSGRGRLAWDEVGALLTGMHFAWADYDGFHVGADFPTPAPPYTHLWAWNSDQTKLARVRIDGGDGIVGLLTTTPERDGQLVQVAINQGVAWGKDGQLGRELDPQIANGQFQLYELQMPLPATFVAMLEQADQEG